MGGGARRLRKRLFRKRNRRKYCNTSATRMAMSVCHAYMYHKRGSKEKKAKLLEFGPNYEHSNVRNRQNVRNYEKGHLSVP